MTRHAISPRLAMRILGGRGLRVIVVESETGAAWARYRRCEGDDDDDDEDDEIASRACG
jgi:hypothetical protein